MSSKYIDHFHFLRYNQVPLLHVSYRISLSKHNISSRPGEENTTLFIFLQNCLYFMNDVNQRFKPSMLQNHFDTRIYAFNALLYLRPARILLTVLLGLRSDTQGSIVKDSASVDGRKHRQILIFGQTQSLLRMFANLAEMFPASWAWWCSGGFTLFTKIEPSLSFAEPYGDAGMCVIIFT